MNEETKEARDWYVKIIMRMQGVTEKMARDFCNEQFGHEDNL